MTQLVFATNNQHKVSEIQHLAGNQIKINSLRDIGCTDDIPETADTLQGNALLKAQYVKTHFGLDCFADDTGLEVDALGGRPGVYSARYAGDNHDFEANIDKLLFELEKSVTRTARFRTVIALLADNNIHYFEGIIEGSISLQRIGNNGFGYDPVFIPKGFSKSFAEMSLEEKNLISHRAIATQKLVAHLLKKQ
jgi:XTP/dITP diphosphohydrolase